MNHPDPRHAQRSPLPLPSLNIAQVLALFVELRDLAEQLVELHRQQIALLRERPADAVTQRYDRSTLDRMRAALTAFEELVFKGLGHD